MRLCWGCCLILHFLFVKSLWPAFSVSFKIELIVNFPSLPSFPLCCYIYLLFGILFFLELIFIYFRFTTFRFCQNDIVMLYLWYNLFKHFYSFAWLELISHRSFMPKMLTGNGQKGWPHVQRLLVDLFQYMEPFLRHAELGVPVCNCIFLLFICSIYLIKYWWVLCIFFIFSYVFFRFIFSIKAHLGCS